MHLSYVSTKRKMRQTLINNTVFVTDSLSQVFLFCNQKTLFIQWYKHQPGTTGHEGWTQISGAHSRHHTSRIKRGDTKDVQDTQGKLNPVFRSAVGWFEKASRMRFERSEVSQGKWTGEGSWKKNRFQVGPYIYLCKGLQWEHVHLRKENMLRAGRQEHSKKAYFNMCTCYFYRNLRAKVSHWQVLSRKRNGPSRLGLE